MGVLAVVPPTLARFETAWLTLPLVSLTTRFVRISERLLLLLPNTFMLSLWAVPVAVVEASWFNLRCIDRIPLGPAIAPNACIGLTVFFARYDVTSLTALCLFCVGPGVLCCKVVPTIDTFATTVFSS